MRRDAGLSCADRSSAPGRSCAETSSALDEQGLLIALRERIRLDQFGRLVDHLELAIELRLADAGLGPQMVVRMDLDVTFRRLGEFDTRRRRRDLVDIE